MSKKFRELEKVVGRIKKEISATEVKITEAKTREVKTEGDIEKLTGELESVLVKEDVVKITALEKEISGFRELGNRDKILIPALGKKIDQLEIDLAQAQNDLDFRFSELAAKWLSDEVRTYDAIAGNLIAQLRKLFACSKLLHDRDHPNVYRDTLGDGHKVLMNLKIPVLENFDIGEFNDPARKFSLSQDDINRVKDEIIK